MSRDERPMATDKLIPTLQFQIIGEGGGSDRQPKYQKTGEVGPKNVLGQKWQPVITNYGCPKQNFFAPYLDIVDTGATITLNKIRKTNQSNFTITQSRNIQIYVFDTSLIQP